MARVILSEADHALVTEAVAAAERSTSGEIVTIVAARSSSYADIAWAWAAAIALFALACIAAWPALLTAWIDLIRGGWSEIEHHRDLLPWVLVAVCLKFLVARLLLTWLPLRDLLTPARIKHRRVRDRAIDLFRVAAEARTAARTGVLIYVSLAEHRAEIVADAGVHAAVPAERWGDAMAALVDAIREGRPGEGLAAAVTAVGVILATVLPRGVDDRNELPDRLIEL